uniref:D-glycerate dehydrogenase n=1 Tax=Candidatus Caldatribacterium saccharofermentans TaxID=1454753 RepID=A0A7V4TFI1_9BACT
MRRPTVFITRRIPEEGIRIVASFCEVEVSDFDGVLPRKMLLEKVQGKDGILCLLTDTIDREVMEAAGPNLKVIANYAVGYNNIDVEEATRRGIMVTNTPGVLTETTADLAWALMMSVARRIVEADRFVRAGKFRGWEPMLFLGTDVYGATLGIVGFGRIGQAMARRALGFDMTVLYYDLQRVPEDVERQYRARFVPLPELLQTSDFVSLHVPLTKDTYHLIGERELRMMKQEAYLINTARGPVVDEKALVRALREGWIRGAALDVFEREPEVEPELLELENVVLAPHIGSASYATRTKMAEMAAENLVKALQGEIPPNLVNPEVLKGRAHRGLS